MDGHNPLYTQLLKRATSEKRLYSLQSHVLCFLNSVDTRITKQHAVLSLPTNTTPPHSLASLDHKGNEALLRATTSGPLCATGTIERSQHPRALVSHLLASQLRRMDIIRSTRSYRSEQYQGRGYTASLPLFYASSRA